MTKMIAKQSATQLPHCHVMILDSYLSKVPPGLSSTNKFQLSPLPFTPTVRGRGSTLTHMHLQCLLKTMCNNAGIEGNCTNHSLQATETTVLFDAGYALRTYERISVTHKLAVSSLLADTAESHSYI